MTSTETNLYIFCKLGKNEIDWLMIPNYIEDLDACREFERYIAHNDMVVEYLQNLVEMCGIAAGEWNTYSVFGICNATAEQKCKAFVMTTRIK